MQEVHKNGFPLLQVGLGQEFLIPNSSKYIVAGFRIWLPLFFYFFNGFSAEYVVLKNLNFNFLTDFLKKKKSISGGGILLI